MKTRTCLFTHAAWALLSLGTCAGLHAARTTPEGEIRTAYGNVERAIMKAHIRGEAIAPAVYRQYSNLVLEAARWNIDDVPGHLRLEGNNPSQTDLAGAILISALERRGLLPYGKGSTLDQPTSTLQTE